MTTTGLLIMEEIKIAMEFIANPHKINKTIQERGLEV
jgi:hypothetical protein